MKYEPSDLDKFNALVDRVLAVPHSVIKERVEEERKRSAAKAVRPGPKPKGRVKRSGASDRASMN